MAIITFALTQDEFIQGNKTVTRRSWADKHFEMWARLWDMDRRVHDAWDRVPIAGGRKIGTIELTARPYKEKLSDMPQSDLIAEGGMCSSIEEFCTFIGKSHDESVAVIRFRKL